jgi:hypothetical protein
MPKPRAGNELTRRLAVLGAQVRLHAIEAERQSLEAFIRSVGGDSNGTAWDGEALQPRTRRPGRHRRPMSTSARKAVSERMKAYWAGRREQKAAGARPLRSAKKR